MAQGLLDRAWTVTANRRKTYTSLNDTAGWWFYENHLAIKAKMTLKWSCDGTTGPSGASDTTDRLTAENKCITRGASGSAAQSWAVYTTTTDGVQILITYQGGSDDVLKIGYSVGGLYTLASPSTYPPTATDECAHTTVTVIGTGTSLDRVMSIWMRDDGKGWRSACFRSGTLQAAVGVDKATPLVGVRALNPIFTGYYKLHFKEVTRQQYVQGSPVGGPPADPYNLTAGIIARVYTDSSRIVSFGGGEVTICDTNYALSAGIFNSDKPAAQNNEGCVILPIFWNGPKVAQRDGFFACPIDWWCGYTSSVALPGPGQILPGYDPGDMIAGAPRSRWLVAIGAAAIWPWRDAAVSMEIS